MNYEEHLMNKKIEDIQDALREFSLERDWDKFHSPKNLSMAISGEVGELMEHFQWLTEEQSFLKEDTATHNLVEEELADIFLYLVRLSDRLSIDIIEASLRKIESNKEKYPVVLCKGKSTKYNHL